MLVIDTHRSLAVSLVVKDVEDFHINIFYSVSCESQLPVKPFITCLSSQNLVDE